MANLDEIFKRIDETLRIDDKSDFASVLLTEIMKKSNENKTNKGHFISLKNLILKIIEEIDDLADVIKGTENIMISVKHQKILRNCFQVIAFFGISNCLIPGLGLNLPKLCALSQSRTHLELTDEQKYEILVQSTDFFHRSYHIPVLKNIIMTFHLSDYLAALIQLAFAPLKKPGVYKNFVMTDEKYIFLSEERHKYVEIYEHLVANCFQPMLMKEMLVLQNIKQVDPPAFVKRVIAKEMSRRLISPGGLLSLIRCFLESHDIDTGVEWKKIDMLCKIVSQKHGKLNENEYLTNICIQLRQILTLNNVNYLTTAVSCILSLSDKYPEAEPVNLLLKDVLQPFDYDSLITEQSDPGTIVLTSQEVEHYILMLHACTCSVKHNLPKEMLSSNLFLLFSLFIKCTNNNIATKLNDIILKILELLDKNSIIKTVKEFIYDSYQSKSFFIAVEEYNAGLVLKCIKDDVKIPTEERIAMLVNIFNKSTNTLLTEFLFESFLHLFLDLNINRQTRTNESVLLTSEEGPMLLNEYDEKYASILILLSEVSSTPKTLKVLKTNPTIAIDFVEKLLSMDKRNTDECSTIALVLLNSVLANTNKTESLRSKLTNLIPILNELSQNNDHNSILCREIISLINSEYPNRLETAYGKALSNVFDSLLPVRAHGIIELTKLIDAADTETISKRHYVFCLFQENLKDSDSYVYLSAINGIAALTTHCTEDVLSILCKEFLQISTENIETKESNNKLAELRMKIGDIIVKVTKRLGEMAVTYKSLLLNTFLCGCRDEDPLIRTSALSNLAEIALILHYRVGTILYEMLLCIWNIIETDKAIECRRAAVMVISSLLKGLGRDTLIQLKENLLPIYRTLNKLYKDENEDCIVRLHAQLALEELNDIVKEFLFASLPMDREICISSDSIQEIKYK